MKRFTPNDSCCRSQTKKTKRCFGFLAFCMMILIGQVSFAQTETTEILLGGGIIIATGEPGQGTGQQPINSLLSTQTGTSNPFSRSISLYAQTEIIFDVGSSGNITKLAWLKNGGGVNNAYIKIWMKHVTNEQWSSNPVIWEDEIVGATEVFTSSAHNIQPGGTGTLTGSVWHEITLDTSFEWNGNDNIAVFVEWERTENVSAAINWRHNGTNLATVTNTPRPLSNATRVGNNWDILAELNTVNANRPVIRFTIEHPPVTCPVPTDLVVSNITSDSAKLLWESEGNLFEIEYGPEGYELGTGTVVTGGAEGNFHTFTDLTPNTTYQYYIRRYCGSEEGYSFFFVGSTFTTGCNVFSDFYEGFETTPVGSTSNSTVPDCWRFINTGIESTGVGNGFVNNLTPHTVPGNFYTYNGTAANEGHYILVSPETDNLGNGTMRVKFWARTTVATEPATTIDVGTLSYNDAPATFTVVQSIPLTTEYTEYVVNLPAGTDDYFGFRHDLVTKGRYVYIDTITYEEIPSCPDEVSGLTATNITTSSADLGWASPGTLFDIEYGPQGFTPGTGTIIPGVTAPYTLSGLDLMTWYDFYVRQDCGNGDKSPWVYPLSFQTACGVITSGFYEGFDNTPAGTAAVPTIPACWTMIGVNEALQPAGTGARTVVEGNTTNPAHTLLNHFQINNTGNHVATAHNILVSPETDNLGNGTMRVRFWARTPTATGTTMAFGALSSNTDPTTFTSLQDFTLTNVYTEYIVELPAGTDDYFGFKITQPTALRTIYIDTVSYEEIPTCSEVPLSTLNVSNITSDAAHLSWGSLLATSFEIEYGPSGFTLGTGELVPDIEDNLYYDVSGLTPNTSYDFYVRPKCTDISLDWTGPVSFRTACVAIISDFFEDFDTTPVGTSTNPTIPDCWRFIDSGGGYGFVEAGNPQTVPNNFSMYNGGTAEAEGIPYILVSPLTDNLGNGTKRVKFWARTTTATLPATTIDFGTLSDSTDPSTFTPIQSIPLTTAYTEYIVELPAGTDDFFGFRHDMVTKGRAVNIDTVTYEAIPPCAEVPTVSLNASDITTNSAELSWSSLGDLFDIIYGPFGFNIASGTLIEGIENHYYTLSGLSPGTTYQYYVRRDCGEEDGKSTWTGPFGFDTLCVPVSGFNENFDGITAGPGVLPVCWSKIGPSTAQVSFTLPYSSPNNLYMLKGVNSHNYLVTPELDNLSGNTHWLRFKARTTSYAPTTLTIGYLTDATQNNTFVEIETITFTGTAYPSEDFVILPSGLPSTARYLAFRNNIDNRTIYLDDIRWEFAPDCMYPMNLGSDNISAASTILSWTGTGTEYDIEYGPAGYIQGSDDGTIITAVGNPPYTLSGLLSGTTYDYYVRQDCTADEDGYSVWTGPFQFTAGTYAGNIPTMLNADPLVTDDACAIQSLTLEVPEGFYLSTLKVKYMMISYNTAWMSQQRSVLYSPTLNKVEEQIASHPSDYPGYYEYERDVDFDFDYESNGTIEFVLKAWRTNHGSGCSTDHVFVMDGTWVLIPEFELIPTCPNPPTELGYTNITEDSVDLIWQSEEGTLFEVRWGTLGFDPEDEEGTLISAITTTSYTLSGLDSSIAYEFYVRRDCSAGDEEDYGDWAGPFKFNSGYCLPTSQLTQYISAFSTGLALENISYTSTAINPGGYGNKTDLVVSREPGESFTFSTNFIGGQNAVRIWVDWNHNFLFEEDEEVFSGSNPGPGNLVTGSLAIPAGTEPGNYVMRTRTVYGASASPQPCGEVQYGEALDFTLHVACVIAAPAGEANQTFTPGQTLANLDITGVGLAWYADSELTDVLNETHELVHGVTYYVVSSNEYCQSEALAITVTDICFDFAAPAGDTVQTFTPGQTLTNLDVTGTGLTWYAEETLDTVLENSAELVHGATYYVISSNANCQSEALAITVTDLCFGFAAPAGEASQAFTQGQTLADLDVTGIGLTWYAEEALDTVLEDNTELVHGVTYYVVATNDDCQSEALAVTVTEEVSTADFDRYAFKYYPNPVNDVLYFSSDTPISDVTVINMLGQKLNVFAQPDNTRIDMMGLPSGNYILNVTIRGIVKTFKIVKVK